VRLRSAIDAGRSLTPGCHQLTGRWGGHEPLIAQRTQSAAVSADLGEQAGPVSFSSLISGLAGQAGQAGVVAQRVSDSVISALERERGTEPPRAGRSAADRAVCLPPNSMCL
jgi:hypothetical protein